MKVYNTIVSALLIMTCLAGVCLGFWTFLGDVGTSSTRVELIARWQGQPNPAHNSYRFITDADLADVPEDVREQYRTVVKYGGSIAQQGNWDKLVMYIQSFLLVGISVVAFLALHKASQEARELNELIRELRQ